jgi:iron-sulfur cluster repair protein YtfE (RIC family)
MSTESPEHRAYRAILAQHQELKALLGRIDRALAERKATIPEVGDLLGQLGDRLVKHFATEEDGGYFAEALAHAPQLISKANQLLAQHPKMRAQARQITIETQPPPVGGADAWWEETSRRFLAFREELLKHEGRENVLLQEAYGRDIGSHD